MDDDGDDFTFPTVAAAARGPTAPERQLDRGDDAVPLLLQLPAALPNNLAAGASPLWPFAGESVPKTTTTPSSPPPVTAADDEQALVPLSGSSGQQDGVDGHRVAADDDRMDLLWEGTRTPTTTTRPIAGHAGPPPLKQRAIDVDDDKHRASALADAERMDKLWESFNDDLVLRHRARARRAKSAAAAAGSRVVPRAAAGGPDDDPGDDDRWYLCNYSPPSSGADDDDESDQDQETTSASSPAERRGYGCAPTMLRASSRAGGAGQFCGVSPRARRRRGRRGWALLLRLFRRLFAVETTAPSSSRRHSSLYVP